MPDMVTLWRPGTTRWLVVESGDEAGSLACPSGRRFAPGDYVNLPHRPPRTPPDRGVVWHVAAVEDATGWDGRLILDDPRTLDNPS